MSAKIIFTMCLLVSVSCASRYRHPESFESKMMRYRARRKHSILPILTPDTSIIKFKSRTNSRKISSVKNAPKKEAKQSYTASKKLYFINLMGQYQQLKRYTIGEELPPINICPSFHGTLLNYKEKNGSETQGKITLNFDKKYKTFDKKSRAKYPELSLPVKMNSAKPTVADIASVNKQLKRYGSVSKLMEHALNIHLAQIHSELRELCEYGSSEHYYAYQNLKTHIRNNPEEFNPSVNTIQALLKVSLFINRALIKSLSKMKDQNGNTRGLASKKYRGNKQFKIMLKHMGTEWSSQYFQ